MPNSKKKHRKKRMKNKRHILDFVPAFFEENYKSKSVNLQTSFAMQNQIHSKYKTIEYRIRT